MANKMITEKDLRDSLLSAVIRSEPASNAPAGFMDDVMNRIASIPAPAALKPYKPPIWLKWGIPGIIVSILIGMLFWGTVKEPVRPLAGTSFVQESFKQVSSWFSTADTHWKFPDLNVSANMLWIVLGGIVLTWSFLLLARFLEKRVRN
jgi:hypothetical protein